MQKENEKRLTAQELRKILQYDPETGKFIWLVNRQCVRMGSEAGNLQPNGRIYIKVNAKSYQAHRLAWLYVHGEWPKGEIDHINRNPADNRIANLRDVDRSLNQHNCGIAKNNTSGHTGVTWNKNERRWHARIALNGRRVHCGFFDELSDAVAARQRVKSMLLGHG